MNKKFLSVALLGTLMVSSGAFVGCADYDDDIANLQQQINQLSSSSQTTVQGVQDKIAALDSQASALEQAKNDLANQLNNAKADAAAAADKALKAAQDASADAKKAAEDLTAAIARVANLEAKVEGLEKAVKDLQAAKDELSANLTAVTDRLAKAEHQAADNAAAIAQAQADLKALDAKVAAVSSEIGARIDVIDEKLNNIEKNYVGKSELQDKLNELNKQDAELKLQIEANANYLKEVKEALAKLQGADSEILAKIVKASEEIAANQKAIAALQEAINNLKTAATSYATKDELNQRVLEITNRLKSIEEYSGSAQIALNAADIRDLQRDLKALAEKEDADVKELKGMIADAIAKAEKELAEAVSTLNKTIEDTKKELEDKISDVDTKVEENAGNIATLTFNLGVLEMNVSLMRSELETKMQVADDSLYALITEEYKALVSDLAKDTWSFLQDSVIAVFSGEDARIEGKLDEYIKANNLAIAGIQNKIVSLEAALAAINGQLKAVVFQPEFYLDGIEAAEYTYLKYAPLSAAGDLYVGDMKNNTNNNVKIASSFVWQYYHSGDIEVPVTPNYKDIASITNNVFVPVNIKAPYTVVGVADSVQFALNPSNAVLTAKQVELVVRNLEAVTRANEAKLNVERTYIKNGILTVVYTVNDPLKLITANHQEHNSVINRGESVTTIELQANLGDTIINSDWGVLYETAVKPVAIAINESGAAKKWNVASYCGQKAVKNELFKNPYEALKADPTTVIGYDDENGFDLADFLCIHVQKCDDERADRADCCGDDERQKTVHQAITLKQAKERYGLEVEFYGVPYGTEENPDEDPNWTNPTAYLGLSANSEKNADGVTKGHVVAGTVDQKGNHLAAQGPSSIDKQPLVQVLVKHGKDVVLDGYVKLLIDRAVGNVAAPVFEIPAQNYNCKGVTFRQTWSQVSALLLEQTAHMSKLEFFDNYELETYPGHAGVAKQYKNVKAVGAENVVSEVTDFTEIKWEETYTEVKERVDGEGTTNTVLEMTLDIYAQQHIYELNDKHEDYIWVKYVRKSNPTPNEGIFVKLHIALNNHTGKTFDKRNDNLWFQMTPAKVGTIVTTDNNALRFNVDRPMDMQHTRLFERDLDDFWEGMRPSFLKKENQNKQEIYYFHPWTNNVVVTDEYTGKKYELHVDYNSVVCDEWHGSAKPVAPHAVATQHEIKNIDKMTEAQFHSTELNHKLNIKAEKTIYYNDVLYAREKGTSAWVRIAVLNPATGYVTYLHDQETNENIDNANPCNVSAKESEMAKIILNAVSHDKAEAMVYVGLYDVDTCDHIIAMNYKDAVSSTVTSVFPAFFLRPLDMGPVKDQEVLDAKANGDTFSVLKALDFEDWRDVKILTADYKNVWLLAYYEVNTLKIDLENMKTNMNYAKNDFSHLLKDINIDMLNSFSWAPSVMVGPDQTIAFDLTAYDYEAMGTKATYDAISALFGTVKYVNHGGNTSDFDVKIPVEVGYAWGTIKTTINVHINGTMANGQGGEENK